MEMQITSKGQVTIPVHIREKYNLGVNSRVDFIERGGEIILSPINSPALNNWSKVLEVLDVKDSVEYIRMLRGHDANDPGLPQ